MSYFENLSNAFNWLVHLKDDLIKSKSLEYIIVLAITAAILFGVVFYVVDTNIHSLGDGIWYALATITHVGYGDVVPTTFLGRLLGAMLILLGLGLFALFTACFSAALIGRDLVDVKKEVSHVEKESFTIVKEENRILQELARMSDRIEQLEKQIGEYQKSPRNNK